MEQIFETIKNHLDTNKIVLFMKGTKDVPMCGFSNAVVSILKDLEADFLDINVLENNDIREGIKQFTNWPTIPQLYINKEFVGGCDIVVDMYKSGELQSMLKNAQ